MTKPDWLSRQKIQLFNPYVLANIGDHRRDAKHSVTLVAGNNLPTTELQALMETPPHGDPEESWEEKHEKFAVIHDAIDSLTERERFVIESKFWRGLGMDLIARDMGLSKTQVRRIRDSAIRKLEEALGGTFDDE